MSYEGHNVIEMDPYRVDRAIRAADREASDRAIAEMRRCTEALIAAYQSGDEFRILRCGEEADAARVHLMNLTGLEVKS